MSEDDPFAGAKFKLERANRHINDFRTALCAFHKSQPVITTTEKDSASGEERHFIRLKEPVSANLRLCAADAIYNMRSALDIAVCATVRVAGRSPSETYFPHGTNLGGFRASIAKKCKKVPETVREAITLLEPYHGGQGYLLRVLHDLNTSDKHTDLISAGVSLRKITLNPAQGNGKISLAVCFADAPEIADLPPISAMPATKVLLQLLEATKTALKQIETANGDAKLTVFSRGYNVVLAPDGSSTIERIEP
jgi:hypothetical protein